MFRITRVPPIPVTAVINPDAATPGSTGLVRYSAIMAIMAPQTLWRCQNPHRGGCCSDIQDEVNDRVIHQMRKNGRARGNSRLLPELVDSQTGHPQLESKSCGVWVRRLALYISVTHKVPIPWQFV